MTIFQASFFWQNDKPQGLGFTFGPSGFTPEELTELFETGPVVKQYMRDSDNALGSNIVGDYLAQLQSIAQAKQQGQAITLQEALLAALNILWLSSRGFIPNDEFNGVQFVHDVG